MLQTTARETMPGKIRYNDLNLFWRVDTRIERARVELDTAVSRKVVQLKSIEVYATIPKGMMGCGCSLFTSLQLDGRCCNE